MGFRVRVKGRRGKVLVLVARQWRKPPLISWSDIIMSRATFSVSSLHSHHPSRRSLATGLESPKRGTVGEAETLRASQMAALARKRIHILLRRNISTLCV